MDPEEIVSVFESVATALRADHFKEPTEGWSAAMIGAHLALNNDLVAEMAERIIRGEHPRYDNESAVDETILREFVKSTGGLEGVADEVNRSAIRFANARRALDADNFEKLLHTVIRDNGKVVRDCPVAIGALVEGNATIHLRVHVEQLRELQTHERMADPPDEFDEYELIILMRGSHPPQLSDEESELLQRQHLGYLNTMREAGYLKVAGPFSDQPDDVWRGMGLYHVGSLEEAVRLASQDPAVRAGHLALSAMKWYCAKGAVTFPLMRSTHAERTR
jgi:uncharacterized protein YciI